MLKKVKKQGSWKSLFVLVLGILLILMVVSWILAWVGTITTTGWKKTTYWRPTQTSENMLLQDRLRSHVTMLSQTIGDRRIGKDVSLQQAADYITNQFNEYGYESAFQTYAVNGHDVRNILATRRGTALDAKKIVVGAHYDTANNPGADDNASGVALLLELSRVFVEKHSYHTIEFVAFTNEEPPYFKTNAMGSKIYAHAARERQEPISAALILESLGYYTDAPNSQSYPPFFGFFYPNAGNFVTVVSDLSSRHIVGQVTSSFREVSSFPMESISTTALVPGIDFSDNWSFWQEGYPAVMISDAAFYRNPHYHRATDTVETINFPAMAEIGIGLEQVIERMASQ